jgi:hydrophobic/amphiphilic exporter-1 (mainly G- bacteria), HAE1 family
MSGPFIRFFANHPTAANLLMLIFIFLGLGTVQDIRRETFPDFTPKEVEIIVTYPGASAEEIEEAICQRIEDSLDEVNHIEEIRSEAQENRARVVVEMRDEGDFSRFLDDIKTEVEAIDDFPEEVERAIIKQLGKVDPVVSIAVTGPMSVPDLKLFSEKLKDRLLLLEEVSQVNILGFSDHQIRIEIPAQNLLQLGMNLNDITENLSRQNVDLPAGTIETPDQNVMLRFQDKRYTVPEFENLIITSYTTGEEIRLGDIAKITDRFELDEDKIIFNGQRAGLLKIMKMKSEDSIDILDAVQGFLEKERLRHPPEVKMVLTQNVSDIVRDRLTMLVRNGVQGLILVFLTMWLFFTLRTSFWVTMGLPISFLGTFYVMHVIGFSLNMLTMVGLLVALGLLMDDAIVISENISSHSQRGKKPLDAAVDGTLEVLPGVFSSFLTTVAIFGSIAVLIEGEIGLVLWVMPVILIVTLTVSLIEAFFILPHHLSHSISKNSAAPGNFKQKVDTSLNYLREQVLGRIVDWSVKWRYFFIGLIILIFVFSLGMLTSGKIKIIAFPEIDGDVLETRILLPQGTPLHRTEEIVGKTIQALKEVNEKLKPLQPEGQPLVQNINVQFNKNLDANETGTHVATVSVDLLKAEVRNAKLDTVKNMWRDKLQDLPDIINLTFKEPTIGPGGLPIEIRLQGSDLEQLKQASLELQDWLNQYVGVFDLNDDLRPGKPEIRVRLKTGALAQGMDASAIANQLRAAFYGQTADEFQVGSESYEIDVQLSTLDQNSLDDLDYFYVTTKSGERIPLKNVANLEYQRGTARISRVNSVHTVTIEGDVDTHLANAAEILTDTKVIFLPSLKQKYPDILFTLEGQEKESNKTGKSMLKAFLVGIIGVFVLLSFQFRNYVEPLAVMSAIPLALVGVIWGHYLMGLDISMVSLMGLVSLTGVVINDSILLVTFIKHHLKDGDHPEEAAKKASRLRFRAILLTSLTTIMGLLPLLMEKSLQAQVLIPLVTSIVFGMLASTVLVLLVVPVLYAILGDFDKIHFEK